MSIVSELKQNTPIYPLVTFRILFGLMMMFSTVRFVSLGWIEAHFTEPSFHFHYYGFSWISPLGTTGMYVLHAVMFLSALGITLGYRYRLSAVMFFLVFTYIELIDVSYYLNHYYYVSLVAILLILIPTHRAFSLDEHYGNTDYADEVPQWMIYSFMLMVAIVYLYAGLAKINTDWLIRALPLKIWLPAKDHLPIIGFCMKWDITPYVFSWAGMIFDTSIIAFLWMRATRVYAYIAVILFHVLTGILFQIGIFPLVMISSATIFFSHAWHRKLLSKIVGILGFAKSMDTHRSIAYVSSNRTQLVRSFLILFFCFQLIFPWRYMLYAGNHFWTEEGYRFGWRVMLMEKSGAATFYVKDGLQGREGKVVNSDFLSSHQEKQMAMQPDMILQYAHYLGAVYKSRGMNNPVVTVEAYVTLNGRPSRLLIDPQVDLMKVEDTWKPKSWILKY